ncbi:MAG: 30S ribosomal protein S14, partial [Nitrosomonas sp.]
LNKMPRDSAPVRLRNRCQLTGRPRGNYRKFKISRLCFREMANNGLIPGVTKSSW